MRNALLLDGIDGSAIQRLTEAGFSVKAVKQMDLRTLLQEIPEIHFLGVRSATRVTYEVMVAGKNLLAIGRGGVGMENIDVDAATKLGIVAFNTPGANAESVAECVTAQILAALHRLPQGMLAMSQGVWAKGQSKGRSLQGKRVGIVGAGYIGKWIAKFLASFGAELSSYDINPATALPWAPIINFEELIAASDIITLHLPLNDETRGLINAKVLGQMKKGAILVNFARGELIDERAVVEALQSGQLSSYIVDVYSKEPPDFKNDLLFVDQNLLTQGKIIATPHLGAQSDDAQESVAEALIAQMLGFFKDGRMPWGANFPTFQLERKGASRLIVFHQDVPGVMASILETLKPLNVAGSVNDRSKRGGTAYTVIDVDSPVEGGVIERICQLDAVLRVHLV